MNKLRIIVVVQNGIVNAVYSNETEVNVDVLDYDGSPEFDDDTLKYIEKLEGDIKNLKQIF